MIPPAKIREKKNSSSFRGIKKKNRGPVDFDSDFPEDNPPQSYPPQSYAPQNSYPPSESGVDNFHFSAEASQKGGSADIKKNSSEYNHDDETQSTTDEGSFSASACDSVACDSVTDTTTVIRSNAVCDGFWFKSSPGAEATHNNQTTHDSNSNAPKGRSDSKVTEKQGNNVVVNQTTRKGKRKAAASIPSKQQSFLPLNEEQQAQVKKLRAIAAAKGIYSSTDNYGSTSNATGTRSQKQSAKRSSSKSHRQHHRNRESQQKSHVITRLLEENRYYNSGKASSYSFVTPAKPHTRALRFLRRWTVRVLIFGLLFLTPFVGHVIVKRSLKARGNSIDSNARVDHVKTVDPRGGSTNTNTFDTADTSANTGIFDLRSIIQESRDEIAMFGNQSKRVFNLLKLQAFSGVNWLRTVGWEWTVGWESGSGGIEKGSDSATKNANHLADSSLTNSLSAKIIKTFSQIEHWAEHTPVVSYLFGGLHASSDSSTYSSKSLMTALESSYNAVRRGFFWVVNFFYRMGVAGLSKIFGIRVIIPEIGGLWGDEDATSFFTTPLGWREVGKNRGNKNNSNNSIGGVTHKEALEHGIDQHKKRIADRKSNEGMNNLLEVEAGGSGGVRKVEEWIKGFGERKLGWGKSKNKSKNDSNDSGYDWKIEAQKVGLLDGDGKVTDIAVTTYRNVQPVV